MFQQFKYMRNQFYVLAVKMTIINNELFDIILVDSPRTIASAQGETFFSLIYGFHLQSCTLTLLF